jgi:hypothetical protein
MSEHNSPSDNLASREDHYVGMYLMAVTRWHDHCDAILACIRDGGTLASVVNVVEQWLDGSDALDDDAWALIKAARERAEVEPT